MIKKITADFCIPSKAKILVITKKELVLSYDY